MSSFWFMIATVLFLLSAVSAIFGFILHRTDVMFVSLTLGILSVTAALFTLILQGEKK